MAFRPTVRGRCQHHSETGIISKVIWLTSVRVNWRLAGYGYSKRRVAVIIFCENRSLSMVFFVLELWRFLHFALLTKHFWTVLRALFHFYCSALCFFWKIVLISKRQDNNETCQITRQKMERSFVSAVSISWFVSKRNLSSIGSIDQILISN